MTTPLRERPDAPLGTLIFRAGLLPAETIENALEEGVKTGRRLGEILVERGLLQEEDLTRLLAGQKGLPFVSLRAERIDLEATKTLSEDQARLFSALPIRFEEGLPLVAVADPTNDVLNRNIREALGQDVRFVVAGRTELNEVIGEAYSGTLQALPEPPAFEARPEPEAEAEAAPLRVDTSVPPVQEEALVGVQEEPAVAAAPQPEPELEHVPEPEPELEPESIPEPVATAPEPESMPEPVATAPEPELQIVPEAEPEPVIEAPAYEPELEPVASFEPATAQAYEPPTVEFDVPSTPEPDLPLVTEPLAPQSAPQTNGAVPHDFEDGLLPPEPESVEPLQAAPAEAPTPAPPAPEAQPAAPGGAFSVSIRLSSGERLIVAECADIGEAKGYAKAMTKQLGATDPDDWPFVNGRFLKPDTIVSVDVEES
jgi:type IV pilus assembly protein PilB